MVALIGAEYLTHMEEVEKPQYCYVVNIELITQPNID
jgi:hypothetical protein